MKTGYIEITDNKVKFVFHELEKPKRENYYDGNVSFGNYYHKAMESYKASKRTVKVSNAFYKPEIGKAFIVFPHANIKFTNKQKCKAEVNGKATIIELIKE